MDSQPKTRQEKKKNQNKKARPNTLGTGKGTRNKLANLEKAATAVSSASSKTSTAS